MGKRIWIKEPLAIFAQNAKAGIVIEETKIVELVPKGQKPKFRVDEIFDASQLVVIPGL